MPPCHTEIHPDLKTNLFFGLSQGRVWRYITTVTQILTYLLELVAGLFGQRAAYGEIVRKQPKGT